MRCVADFDTENHALKFWGFLKQKGIDSSLEKGDAESKGSCQIWVLDEDQLSLAFSYLNEFKSNPDDPKFSTGPKKDKIEEAIDSDCPLSSASFPGKAPAVSTKVITGKLNFSPNLTNL